MGFDGFHLFFHFNFPSSFTILSGNIVKTMTEEQNSCFAYVCVIQIIHLKDIKIHLSGFLLS